nr:unnamed protein product [Callosobruchus analis]
MKNLIFPSLSQRRTKDKIKLQADYDLHRLETELSRNGKEHDKNSNANIVAVYDLQAVLPCPSGDANYDEIGTYILRYLDSLQDDENKRHVIFYSDKCAYIYAVQHFDWLESTTHKYLVKEHSQNEGDSAHSLIERQIKRSKRSGPVYIPDQYVTLIRSAKMSREPYKVDELCHKDLFDLKQLASDIGFTSYPKKNTVGDPLKISEIKVRAKPREIGTGGQSEQDVNEEGSTSGKKKAGTRTRLFTPTLPSLRLDTSLDEHRILNKNQQDRISHMPSSSSEYLNPPGAGTSSASRLIPNFQRLVSNLKVSPPSSSIS